MGFGRDCQPSPGVRRAYLPPRLPPAAPKKNSMGSLGGALASAGCQMALVEDPAATATIEARAKKRRRPLRQLKQLSPPTAARHD